MISAMILAAGPGTRMRPLTEGTAKPLLSLGGKRLLDHALSRLADAGVARAVVNAHWHGEQVAEYLATRPGAPETLLRRERELLDTGGAVAAAVADGLLGSEPFYVVNGDSFWLDGPCPTLARLAGAFAAETDAVLLLQRTFLVHGEVGFGDFLLDPWGVPRRRRPGEIAPYVFAGLQLASPALFADPPAPPFSLNVVWDRAIAAGRLRAVVHDGLWFHLSRPDDIGEAEHALQAQLTGYST